MRRKIASVLAAYGAIVLTLQVLGTVTGYFTNRRIVGDVDVDGRATEGVPVFVDDGTGTVRRTVTDATGHFRFPIEPSRLRRARLLVCPAGLNPIVSDEQPMNMLGSHGFGFSSSMGRVAVPLWMFGWRSTVPVECGNVVPPPA